MTREIWVLDLGLLPYREALVLQRRIVAAKKRGLFEPEVLLLLEHPAVITLGRRGDAGNVLAPEVELAARGIEVHRVERGGDVTYHGPGQVVGYPIVSLKHLPQRKDVRKFVWNMQEAIIRTLARYGVRGERIDGVIGVWIRRPPPDDARGLVAYPERKIAAIGARVEGWVSFHGFALNITTALEDFELIVPCGLEARGVTSLEVELGHPVPIPEIKAALAHHLGELWGFEVVWREKNALAEIPLPD